MHKTTLSRQGILWMLALLLSLPAATRAQDQDLNLYGFFQAQYWNSNETNGSGPPNRSSFQLQQLNLFLARNFNASFSAFVNAEITNSFSSEHDWGSFALEEAWFRYNYSGAFNVKAGLLVPTFNNLNEIKNRTPLLPYAFRPLVYESTFDEVFSNTDFAPQQAYLQVYGSVPVGDFRLDYAGFLGNSDPSYITSETRGSAVSGQDTTNFYMVGSRVGLRGDNVKVGVSFTVDKANMRAPIRGNQPIPLGLGDVDRYRIGADLSFTVSRFFFEGEFIAVRHSLDEGQQQKLDFLATATPLAGAINNSVDKQWYYVLGGVDVTDDAFVYAMYNNLKDDLVTTFKDGFDAFFVGAGYRPIFPVLLKATYVHARTSGKSAVNFSGDYVFLAASVSF